MLGIKDYEVIIDALKNTDASYSEIARRVGCNPTTIRSINLGENKTVRYVFKDVKFPIKETARERNLRIMADLDGGFEIEDLMDKYDLSERDIKNIIYNYNHQNKKIKGRGEKHERYE